jgi:hypothetical protein
LSGTNVYCSSIVPIYTLPSDAQVVMNKSTRRPTGKLHGSVPRVRLEVQHLRRNERTTLRRERKAVQG